MHIIPNSGFAVLGENNSFLGNNSFSGTVAVVGAFSTTTTAQIGGALTVQAGGANITGPVVTSSTLQTGAGLTVLAGGANVTGAIVGSTTIQAGGALSVLGGGASIIGNVGVTGNMTVTGFGHFGTDGTFGNGLTVNGSNLVVNTIISGDGSLITNMNASNVAFGTLSAARLPASGVVAGTYGAADVTVDVTGRITSIAGGGGGAGNGVTGTANVIAYANGAYPGGLNDYFLTTIPQVIGLRQLDANPDLVWDTQHGNGNSRMYINFSTRPFSGIGTFDSAALNITDSGVVTDGFGTSVGGCINCGFASSSAIRIFASPPGYGGPALGNGFINMSSNSPVTNSYAFIECENPDTAGPGPANVQRFTVYSDGSLYSAGVTSTFAGQVGIGTNCFIAGTLTAGSKHFAIPHPLPELSSTKKLYHTSVESPRANLIYRGRATLAGGRASVDLDVANGMTRGTLAMLADMANADVFLTNRTSFAKVRASISGSQLSITCESAADIEVSWMVVAERLAATMPGEPVDDDGHLVVERDADVVRARV